METMQDDVEEDDQWIQKIKENPSKKIGIKLIREIETQN